MDELSFAFWVSKYSTWQAELLSFKIFYLLLSHENIIFNWQAEWKLSFRVIQNSNRWVDLSSNEKIQTEKSIIPVKVLTWQIRLLIAENIQTDKLSYQAKSGL